MAEKGFLDEVHRELGAKMIPAGKWDIPLFYPGGSVAEHRHTRSGASLFDRTGCRCFQLAGKNVPESLDRIFMRSCREMPVGGVLDNILLRESGHISVLFTMCRMQPEDFLLLIDRTVPAAEVDFLVQKVSEAVEVRELSAAMTMLTVAGKKCREILTAAGAETLPENGFREMISLEDGEGDTFRAIAIGHDRFGEAAIDLCFSAENAAEIYGAIYRIPGVEPAGCAAWESLRIESGIWAVGSDIHKDMIPQECGLEEFLTAGRTFCGSEKAAGLQAQRKLILLTMERHPANPGSVVKLPGGIAAGVVSSSAFCPTAGTAQAICIIDADAPCSAGSTLECEVNGKAVTCRSAEQLPAAWG